MIGLTVFLGLAWGTTGMGGETMKPGNLETIKVATFNLRCPLDGGDLSWDKRAPRQAQIIRENHFDLFGTQEPYVYQLNGLLKLLPGFRYIGQGRDDGKEAGEFSAILYNTERFELLQQETFVLSLTPQVFGSRSWDAACTRICTWGKFRDRRTQKEFFFVNTHLDHVSELARMESAKMIISRLSRLNAKIPLILVGDFNQSPDSQGYRTITGFLQDSRSISATPHQGPNYSFMAFGAAPVTAQQNREWQIDFIFVSSGVRVLTHRTLDNRVDGHYASDHYPVTAELILP